MSDSLALVRFPDGELRVAYFFGDPEIVLPPLFALDAAETLFAMGVDTVLAYMAEHDDGEPRADVEDVEIWADYGASYWWSGLASRRAKVIVEGCEPMASDALHVGVPEWVPVGWRVAAGTVSAPIPAPVQVMGGPLTSTQRVVAWALVFDATPDGLEISDIARSAGVPSAAVTPELASLMALGLAEEVAPGRYAPTGECLLALGL
jgi:hypothetical protein